jgi:hypothetical protein
VTVCILITEGECVRSVWVKWGPEEGYGRLMGMVESVRGGRRVAGLS